MAEEYLSTKDPEDPLTLRALEELARGLPPGATVLDLGCGAGIPATRRLAEWGFSVTGVDFSGKQVELARRLVPGATFVRADMTSLCCDSESFDSVVALHSIIHVPRQDHRRLIAGIYRWLRRGGLFLATLTMTDFEGEDPDWEGWGAAMRWSHYDREANVRMLHDAGFEIQFAEPRTGRGAGAGEETWLWVLARKLV